MHVLTHVDLFPQLRAPRTERVGPPLDREFPGSNAVDDKRTEPAVAVIIEGEGRRRPPGVPGAFVDRPRRELVVSFLEDVGTDPDPIADDALHRVSAAIQLRCYTLDRQGLEASSW